MGKQSFIEYHILTILRIVPLIAVPLIVSFIVFALYINNQHIYNKDVQDLRDNFIKSEKALIKSEVLKIRELIKVKQDGSRVKLQERIRSKVYEAHAIATSIYEKYKNKKSAHEIQHLIVDALSDVRFFEGRGYYFINNNNGQAVLFGGKSKLDEVLTLASWEDIRGNRIVQDQIDVIKSKGEGFNFKFHNKLDIKPTQDSQENREYEKISFVKNFEPYNWHIGTGDYTYNEQKIIQKELLEEINLTGKLQDVSYEKGDYIIIIQADGKVLHHQDSDILNTNISDIKDMNDKSIANKILDVKTSSYIKTFYKNTETGNISENISYFAYIPDWKWIVGSGFYNDKLVEVLNSKTKKLEETNHTNLMYIGLFGSIFFVISIFIALIISRTLKNIFNRYQNKIMDQVNELQDINTTLELRIAEAIKDVQEKDRQLFQQSRMAQMGEMISMIAHQWRQPLGAISGAAMNMKMKIELDALKLEDQDKEYITEKIDDINRYTQSLSTTIDDFRNFYKPNKMSDTIKLEEVCIKALSIIKTLLINNNINIIEEYCCDDKISVYTNEMIQVVLNILKNAQDNFIEKNIKEPYIKISTDNKILSICDNGGGIAEDIINKIFDPYFSTKDEKNGTGLGLYMSKIIVEEHHKAKLEVQNTGEGVCFKIEFL